VFTLRAQPVTLHLSMIARPMPKTLYAAVFFENIVPSISYGKQVGVRPMGGL